jgi:hypothetical protein
MVVRKPEGLKRPSAVIWRWSQTRGLLERTFRHLKLDVADCEFFISLGIALFLLQVESVLWRRPLLPQASSIPPSPLADPAILLYPFNGVTAQEAGLLPWMALAVMVVNAWLMNHIMRKFGGEDASFRPWLLRVRPILAAPPFLGLCVLPLWRALIVSRPSWARRRTKPGLSLERVSGSTEAPRVRWPALWRRLDEIGSTLWFPALWVVPVNLMALRAALGWLTVTDPQTAGLALGLRAARFTLRSLGLLFLGLYLRSRSRGLRLTWSRKALLGVVLASWLVPPVSPFLVTLLAYLLLERRRDETAVHGASILAGSKTALDTADSRGANLGEVPALVRWVFGNSAKRTPTSDVLDKRLGFYRMKTFLLLFDVGLFHWVGPPLAKRYAWLDLLLGIGLGLLCGVLVVLLLVALVARTYAFLARPFRPSTWRRDQERHPSGRYVLLTALAFFGGFFLGLPAAERSIAELQQGLVYCAYACGLMILFVVPGVFQKLTGKSEERGIGAPVWLVVFHYLGQLGAEMEKSAEMAEGLTRFAYRFVLLAPVWALVLWAVRGSWILRPFRLRDAVDPKVSRGTRWKIAFIAVTAALPMGGLAIPLWIRFLRRLEAEPLWEKTGPSPLEPCAGHSS